MDKKTISIVDVSTFKILQEIRVKKSCFGTSFIDGKLFVCFDDNTIQIFDRSGNVLSTLSQKKYAAYCLGMNDKIYYAAHGSDEIFCCNSNGRCQWRFSCGKSDYPIDIANDTSGNVFVACQNSNKVIVIDPNGNESRVLLTSDHGLNQPRTIHYKCTSNTLLVCNHTSGQCFMYKITT